MTAPVPSEPALAQVVGALRCPTCGGRLAHARRSLRCEAGHHFDVARQGYVNLRTGSAPATTGDDAAMVAARQRFLDAGHFAPIGSRLAESARRWAGRPERGVVVDLAAGTGHHLAQVLDGLPDHHGVAVDLSVPALRRAARAHRRGAAVGADVWSGLPMGTGTVALAMSVFGPRNAGEVARVLDPEGAFVVVTPTPEHLHELVGRLGMVEVDRTKQARLRAALAEFTQVDETRLVTAMVLGHDAVADLVAMGPSAHHVSRQAVDGVLATLPPEVEVTAAVRIAVYRPPAPRS